MSDDTILGFPAFASQRNRTFTRTWWAQAWVAALEDSTLDPELLRRSRACARAGRIGSITMSPGRIAAFVDGEDDDPYSVVVLVEPLTDAEWDRFFDSVAEKAGYIAALLDGEMPHELVESAEAAAVRLLPDVGDLEPDCGCPDWGHPCLHAAALCYQVAWLLADDPFLLLLLRGRGRKELIEALQLRSAVGTGAGVAAGRALAATPGPVPPDGIAAREAYMREARDGPPPLPALPPTAAESPALLAVPATRGVDPDALEWLVGDAAARAREMLAAPEPPVALTVWQDTVRIAATEPSARIIARLAGAGDDRLALARAALAWRYGGFVGLEVLEVPWSPPWSRDLELARRALTAAHGDGGEPVLTIWRNHWTLTGRGVQIRYGRDGRWYPCREQPGGWWPAGPPGEDVVDVVAGLLDD